MVGRSLPARRDPRALRDSAGRVVPFSAGHVSGLRTTRAILVLPFVLSQVSQISQVSRTAAAEHDVVVYGGTSAGVVAAVTAKRLGKRVIIVCPDRHLGGLSSGGLGFTDTGDKSVIGGIAREFYHRVWQRYERDDGWRWQRRDEYGNRGQGTPAIDGANRTMWIFEPHVAEAVFEDLVREHEIPVVRDEWLDRRAGRGVVRDAERPASISSITTLAGNTYRGAMFIDATYEGDLLAAAGVSYRVGREASREYDEEWNGVQVGVLHHGHWFQKPIDPWKVPGDPASGLLPHISPDPPGERGAGDHRVQAYCFRMCLTTVDENRIAFPQPDGYDPSEYELLLRVLDSGWREVFQKFDPIPNRKTDTNNHGPFSTDHIGANYDYPDGSYERRREIVREHERYQKGLMYFLANDPRVPDDVRTQMARWGLAKDEFTDNGGWPHQIYVRESRRLAGEYVMTEHDCLDRRATPASVGLGSYAMDSHNVQRYVKPDGFVENEGDIGVQPPRPYEVAYGALVPRRGECRNLLVPVCVSATHIAFGTIRMEPVFMILGQSAATAAVLAIDAGVSVQDVPYERLRAHLLAGGQVLEPAASLDRPARALEGIVVDDGHAKVTGDWKASRSLRPFVDTGYRHDGDAGKGALSARFEAKLERGRYEVRLAYTAHPNRASNVPVRVVHAGGSTDARVDQRRQPPVDGLTASLGEFDFDDTAAVVVSNTGTDGHVIIDAVQFVRVR